MVFQSTAKTCKSNFSHWDRSWMQVGIFEPQISDCHPKPQSTLNMPTPLDLISSWALDILFDPLPFVSLLIFYFTNLVITYILIHSSIATMGCSLASKILPLKASYMLFMIISHLEYSDMWASDQNLGSSCITQSYASLEI